MSDLNEAKFALARAGANIIQESDDTIMAEIPKRFNWIIFLAGVFFLLLGAVFYLIYFFSKQNKRVTVTLVNGKILYGGKPFLPGREKKERSPILIGFFVFAVAVIFLLPQLPEFNIDTSSKSSKTVQNKVPRVETVSFNGGHFKQRTNDNWITKPNPVAKFYKYVKDNPGKNVSMLYSTSYPKGRDPNYKFVRKVFYDRKNLIIRHTFLRTNVKETYRNITLKKLKEQSKKLNADFF